MSEGELGNLTEQDSFLSSAPQPEQHPFYKTVRDRIRNRDFRFIVVGSGHRSGWENKLHFWNDICSSYGERWIEGGRGCIRKGDNALSHPCGSGRHEVAVVEGDDFPFHKGTFLANWSPCAGHIFSREGPR